MSRLLPAWTTMGWTLIAILMASSRLMTGSGEPASALVMESCARWIACVVGVTAPMGGSAGLGAGLGCWATRVEKVLLAMKASGMSLLRTFCLSLLGPYTVRMCGP